MKSLCPFLVANAIWIVASPTYAHDINDYMGGFVLGSSLADAEAHAASNGWTARQVSPDFPNWWVVDGSDFHVGVCDGTIGSVSKEFEGGLHMFASIVMDLKSVWGKPVDTSENTFDDGTGGTSNIALHFRKEAGSSAIVLLTKTGNGDVGVLVDHRSDESCFDIALD